jgi:hypothetical protein
MLEGNFNIKTVRKQALRSHGYIELLVTSMGCGAILEAAWNLLASV